MAESKKTIDTIIFTAILAGVSVGMSKLVMDILDTSGNYYNHTPFYLVEGFALTGTSALVGISVGGMIAGIVKLKEYTEQSKISYGKRMSESYMEKIKHDRQR